ncbi:MAG TPA: hypothetical protein VHC94_19770 [Nitrobacter sp.]|jgi:hypothetical protein|nr:hypothetical protein [Nitrobacter sp.]
MPNENTQKTADAITYVDNNLAPVITFDIAPAHGVLAGGVQVELALRTLNPLPDGSVETKFVTSGRLRCSAAAAMHLRNSLDAALRMLEQPQPSPAAAAKLN